MSYVIQWSKQGAYKKFSGEMTLDELLSSLSEVQCHPDFDVFKYSITDFLDVTNYESFDAYDKLYVAWVKGGEYVNPSLQVGIVVDDSLIIELLKARYEPYTKYAVRYFLTRDECRTWVEKSIGSAAPF